MTTGPQSGVATAAEAFRDTITARSWLAPGLRTDLGTTALDATMRPVDAVTAAGLDWLLPMVQPLQDVLDGLAGNTSAIWSFADAWQRASATVEQAGQRLSRSASATGEQWRGDAADRYLGRATEITESLHGSATTFTALGSIATTMGEAAAGARTQANDLVTDLVARLVPYVGQAIAVEGSVTPNVMTQATSMINSYVAPIADVERRLADTITNLRPLLTDGGTAVAMSGQAAQGIAPDPEPPRTTPPGRPQTPVGPHHPTSPPANDNEPGGRPPSLPRLPGAGAIVGFVARRALGVIGLLIWLDEMFAQDIVLLPPGAPPAEPPAQQPPVPPAITPPSDPVRQQPGLPETTPPGTPSAPSPDDAPPAQDQSPQQPHPTMNAEDDPPSKDGPPEQGPPAAEPPPQGSPAHNDNPSAEPSKSDKVWPKELSDDEKWAPYKEGDEDPQAPEPEQQAPPAPQPFTSAAAFEALQKRRLWAEIAEDHPGLRWSAELAEKMKSDNENELKYKLNVTGRMPGLPSIVIGVSVIYDRTTKQYEDMHLSSGKPDRQ